MIALRLATADDLDELLPRMHAFNAVEGITVDAGEHALALRTLLDAPELGGVWLAQLGARTIGYAVVTYNFDLEFAGRDAFLTEFWIDELERGRGAGATVLALLETELRARDVAALNLLVRRDNPALRLYERAGFALSPRAFMTRTLR